MYYVTPTEDNIYQTEKMKSHGIFSEVHQEVGEISELLELGVYDKGEEKLANVVFAPIHDRRGRSILSVRDQNTFAEALRKKRLMTLVHLFLVHRFKADWVHYVTPTEDNQYQVAKMKSHGIFREVNTEVGQIIVADVDHQRISELLSPDQKALRRLISKEG